MTQWAPHGMGPAHRKVCIVSQPMIQQKLEEEAMGEAVVMEVIVVADKDAMMQDVPVVVPKALNRYIP